VVNAFWIILTGSLVAACCALPGCFLVLRRQALIGDAIAHAILPGIVLTYLLIDHKNTWLLLAGAGSFGLIASFLMDWLHQKAGLKADAAIGIVFTSFFAVGIILVSAFAGNMDVDQECVLYGEIAYVPLDMTQLQVPRAVVTHTILLVILISLIIVFYKQFLITTFDAAFARLSGFWVRSWHYLLMSMVSVVTVASFEAVGAILVIAFLTVPPATAFLLTNRLSRMFVVSVLISIITATIGYGVAILFNASIAGSMATVSGLLFGIAFVYDKLSTHQF